LDELKKCLLKTIRSPFLTSQEPVNCLPHGLPVLRDYPVTLIHQASAIGRYTPIVVVARQELQKCVVGQVVYIAY
jgi:hypothetical protein